MLSGMLFDIPYDMLYDTLYDMLFDMLCDIVYDMLYDIVDDILYDIVDDFDNELCDYSCDMTTERCVMNTGGDYNCICQSEYVNQAAEGQPLNCMYYCKFTH